MISAGGGRRHLKVTTETAAGKGSMANVPPVAKRNVSSPGVFLSRSRAFPPTRHVWNSNGNLYSFQTLRRDVFFWPSRDRPSCSARLCQTGLSSQRLRRARLGRSGLLFGGVLPASIATHFDFPWGSKRPVEETWTRSASPSWAAFHAIWNRPGGAVCAAMDPGLDCWHFTRVRAGSSCGGGGA